MCKQPEKHQYNRHGYRQDIISMELCKKHQQDSVKTCDLLKKDGSSDTHNSKYCSHCKRNCIPGLCHIGSLQKQNYRQYIIKYCQIFFFLQQPCYHKDQYYADGCFQHVIRKPIEQDNDTGSKIIQDPFFSVLTIQQEKYRCDSQCYHLCQ